MLIRFLPCQYVLDLVVLEKETFPGYLEPLSQRVVERHLG